MVDGENSESLKIFNKIAALVHTHTHTHTHTHFHTSNIPRTSACRIKGNPVFTFMREKQCRYLKELSKLPRKSVDC